MKNKTLALCLLGMLTALAVVFKVLTRVQLAGIGSATDKISLLYLPVFISAMMFKKRGWLYSFVIGFLGDTLGFMLFPDGTYIPLYSVVVGIGGIVTYLVTFRAQNIKIWHIIVSVVAVQAICSILCVSYLNVALFAKNTPFWAMVASRLPKQPIIIAVHTVALIALRKIINNSRDRFLKE